ncbi:hypothetical protein SCB71_06480 [Herbiconiux sp. KACC 21604]|uniref:hypothetical protein n=1 Tax=unclassified Herbiconiux TaxID=2618217 RepID=UPI001492F0B7|nr:hypothetical protein [Herbiconiux sp. SALV-R1]QJU52961.1 hypothetical protein HL652_04465 [Herbiconiux sp. SALV-R1]WPO87885.1 hypothetical protein SCB71_06480 [Herbiconiux sp. KACC 21604]
MNGAQVWALLTILFAGMAIFRSYTVAVDGAVTVLIIATILSAVAAARRVPFRGGR